ncbi:MAG: Ig-like domain-containing protein, partial [Gemmatimonadales bacterium]
SPKVDTAYALGDTLQLTALVADARGMAMLAAQVHWLSDDSSIAGVDSAGRVVARGPGVTSVTVAAGGRAARARVWVLPRIAQLVIEGDSVIRIPEGESRRIHAMAWDARSNRITGVGFVWTAADRGVATLDSTGEIRAVAPGTTTVSATAAGLLAQRTVEVVPVPNSITLTAGAEQRAAAGQRLPVPVTVQVVSKSGRPVPAVMVRFDASQTGGRAEPDSALTDPKGSVRAVWTLGALPGRQRLAVQVAAIDSLFVVSAEADPTPRNTRIALLSETLAGEVGSKLAAPVRVQVTDSSGATLADVPVTWSALDGGSFAAVEARTDTLGMARAYWTFV